MIEQKTTEGVRVVDSVEPLASEWEGLAESVGGRAVPATRLVRSVVARFRQGAVADPHVYVAW